ncbi:MAG: NAD(P)/FAD-dependent oxidoreductase [Eubacteriales bacterium]
MKVAIMGAGLSGLACAITLEKHGISPAIFESRAQVGDRFINGEALIPILSRPINDCYAYLSENHGIFLQPLSNIKTMRFYSENKSATLNGHLGFLNSRGRHSQSLENQLSKQVKSRIIFNSNTSYEQLLKDFTHVVLATGDAAYASKIQDFQNDLTVTIKGATVEGSFDRFTTAIWLDNNLAPQGYGYLMPFSEREASITIAYPDYPENQIKDINILWDNFYHRVCSDYNQNLKITDNFEITRYIIGQCRYPRLGNTFFVGNCFGAIMPAFGFGQLAAILTGIYATYDLVGKGNYIELVKPLQESYDNSLVIRRFMEQLDNKKLDSLVSLFNTKLANYLFNNQKLNPFKMASYLLKPQIRIGAIVKKVYQRH